MREKLVKRWYCEFCRKSGCNKDHMRKHEKHCTANPNRVCRMCQDLCEQKPLADLVAIFDGCEALDEGPDEFGLMTHPAQTPEMDHRVGLLEMATDCCPMCMLATVRALRRSRGLYVDIGYRERRLKWFRAVNADTWARECAAI